MSTIYNQEDVANLLWIVSRPRGEENLRYRVGVKTHEICLEFSKLWGDCNIDAILTEMWGKDFIFHDEYRGWFIRPKGLEHLTKYNMCKVEREKIETKRQLQEEVENNAMYCEQNE
tara:strand:+ start:274 stop:621 length:348 start_codon:yes stop_codon:yes gene_type:complete